MTVVFSDDEIRRRFIDMYQIVASFCDAQMAQTGQYLTIDPQLLYLAVVAVYDDIARYKAYHLPEPETQRANSIKRAAYGAKWIVRFNPIVVSPTAGHQELPSHDGLINAKLAVFFALINLEELVETTLEIEKVSFQVNSDVCLDMMYDIVYRGLGGESLMLVLEILLRTATGQNVVTVT